MPASDARRMIGRLALSRPLFGRSRLHIAQRSFSIHVFPSWARLPNEAIDFCGVSELYARVHVARIAYDKKFYNRLIQRVLMFSHKVVCGLSVGVFHSIARAPPLTNELCHG